MKSFCSRLKRLKKAKGDLALLTSRNALAARAEKDNELLRITQMLTAAKEKLQLM